MDLPRTEIFANLERAARNNDNASRKLLNDINDGKSFFIGKRKYRVINE